MRILVGRLCRLACVVALAGLAQGALAGDAAPKDYERARWDPIHFKPAIAKATDEQCLACHKEILERKPRQRSPAGVKKSEVLAWYETLDTYAGEQDTFHRRHLVLPYAKQVMDLHCTTCHQGNDPRDETSGTSATAQPGLTMRKMVDPWVCALCHGQFPNEKMGIPGPWLANAKTFGNSCLTCHASIRTERHKGIPFLKAEAIEKAGAKDSDVCYGCHGGRAWYRVAFPYTAKKWPGWGDPPKGLEGKFAPARKP